MNEDLSMAALTDAASPDVSEELVNPGREMMFGYEAFSAFLSPTNSVNEGRAAPGARRWVANLRQRPGGWLGRMAAGKRGQAA